MSSQDASVARGYNFPCPLRTVQRHCVIGTLLGKVEEEPARMLETDHLELKRSGLTTDNVVCRDLQLLLLSSFDV